MITQSDIERIAKEIGQAADAERVIIFGSHANGRANESSDVDLLVVAETNLPHHKRSRDLYRRIRKHRFSVDIIVHTPEEVRRNSAIPVSFVSQALKHGRTIYARRT